MTCSCPVLHGIIREKQEEYNMIESRCGILCSECKYKEQMNCSGCVNIKKPFWGESCELKSCCENNTKKHCGECEKFPCSVLSQFSYDEKEGDNGKRIEQCKDWCEK